ncbi:MAG: zinc-binding dehydrogenase [Xanthomonadales bacterium]|nr:zinc-binding dehydrogenase [Xanthomonadales bacterium]
MSTMRAAVFCGDGRVELQEVARPVPARDEVCVRLEGCGVCASNLPVWSGKPWFDYPLVPGAPGHEGWGEVVAIGDLVDDVRVGERVALLSTRAYAEYDVAKPAAVAHIPAALVGRPVPGEPLGCAMNVFRRCRIRSGETVAMVGTGFIGALVLQLASRAGASVVALARREYAREVALDCGARAAFATDSDGVASARELTGGKGFDCVIEAAGEQVTLDLASALTSEGGRLVIAGYHQDGPRQVDMQQWNWRGLDVINAHERDPAVAVQGLRDAMAAVVEGRLDPWPLLTHTYPLHALGTAFEAMRERPRGFLKAMVAA